MTDSEILIAYVGSGCFMVGFLLGMLVYAVIEALGNRKH
ncbi:hypothetical protein DEU39_1531 [Chryseobacterium sp. AG363]|nr:hypothetical protein DEU39_1531 [Chryseobacterium sp. AG363]